jgi:hypothetical protein
MYAVSDATVRRALVGLGLDDGDGAVVEITSSLEEATAVLALRSSVQLSTRAWVGDTTQRSHIRQNLSKENLLSFWCVDNT